MAQSTLADQLRLLQNKVTKVGPGHRITETTCLPNCDICHGVGMIRYDVDRFDDRFGKMYPCPNLPSSVRHTIHPCGLYMDDIDRLVSNDIEPYPVDVLYKGNTVNVNMQKLIEVIAKYLSGGYGLVYLYGQYGRGKSMLIQYFIAQSAKAELPALYINASEIMDIIKDGFDQTDPRESALNRISRLNSIPILAIDELDKINITDWSAERLFHIFNNRYEGAMHQQSITLIASNRRPEEISKGIASRVMDGRCMYLEISGDDIRPKMTWE